MKARRDTEMEITQKFIDAIESGLDGKWVRPWSIVGGGMPSNAMTGKHYRGTNALLLLIAGGGIWGTYKQWESLGCQVMKGSKGTMIIRPIFGREDNNGDRPLVAWGAATVFASIQVEGYEAPEAPEATHHDSIDAAEAVINASGAMITVQGDKAFYSPGRDIIAMPAMGQFDSAEAYYSTMLHELAHWTGHKSRLDRDLNTGRFGDDAYAFEELVAELAASFLCAELGVHQGYRDDHAKYLKHWVGILKGDKRAILTAATKAQAAADYILKLAKGETMEDESIAA